MNGPLAHRESHPQHSENPHRKVCHFSGRVQGVGFRCTAANLALQYDVRGYVRNLPDGRVELVIEGPASEVDQLVDELRRKMEGFIRKLDINVAPPTGEFRGFAVRH